MKTINSLILVLFSALVLCPPAGAENKPVPASAGQAPADNIELVRDKLRADKKLLVSVNLELSNDEAKVFWPVYDSYQQELKKLGDRMVAVIQDYAMMHKTLSDVASKRLLEESLAIEKERVGLQQTYLPKFRQVLPEKKVARYYQLENKAHAIVAYDLAKQIPLAK